VATRELSAARRSNQRLRILAVGLSTLLVVALVAGGMAWQQNRRAQAQTRIAQSQTLAAQVDGLVDTRPDLAVLVGLQSLSMGGRERPEPPSGLVAALGKVTHASRQLPSTGQTVASVAFSLTAGCSGRPVRTRPRSCGTSPPGNPTVLRCAGTPGR
jgi:hypothetical protein